MPELLSARLGVNLQPRLVLADAGRSYAGSQHRHGRTAWPGEVVCVRKTMAVVVAAV